MEIPNGVIIIRKSKGRQRNSQKKNDKQRSTNMSHKTKDRVTRTPLNIGGERMCYGRVSSSFSIRDTRRVTLVTNPVISHEWVLSWRFFCNVSTIILDRKVQIDFGSSSSNFCQTWSIKRPQWSSIFCRRIKLLLDVNVLFLVLKLLYL